MKIYLATKPVDFRKGHNGLAALVQNHLRQNPFGGAVYVFRAKRADRVKILYWEFAPVHEVTNCPVDSLRGERAEPSGLVMAYKCLEKSNFNWPAINGKRRPRRHLSKVKIHESRVLWTFSMRHLAKV